ncbi:MAG: pyridoxamine 5'-phosphate oxidase [Bdellovibrionales bacterium]|nr:pyridoxamine 5'-phosphate oxidase [Bdellovibrionales bacterium]
MVHDIASDFHKDPIDQFLAWFEKATTAKVSHPNEATLSTIGSNGYPRSRTVYYKGMHQRQFTFYTNYESDKAKEINENARVSLLFFWHPPLDYQIRVEGLANKMSREESEKYFNSRPRQSQISAWASPQSRLVSNRQELEALYQKIEKQFEGKDIPCPPFWGGYVVKANYFDFMILDKYRLHDRFCYKLSGSEWKMERLGP